jgi:hypothetical protein
MLGTFQQAHLRIEVNATPTRLADSLLRPVLFRQWLAPQQFAPQLPDRLTPDLVYSSWLGPIAITHRITHLAPNHLELSLSGSIDGSHRWHWGEGWVQSELEGITLLPLQLAHTASLLRLRQFLDRA